MQNPTIVVLTDRNDLDDQLFGQFQRCSDLLNQTPVQARDREHLRELLKVASGRVIFTTIQKFMPEKGEKMPSLSDRRNIVVIADEAHRSLYDLIDGLDQEFDEITEGEEQTSREKLKSRWAALEALVGDPKRIRLIAADLVEHFEKRLESMDGKAIVVCMSRRICVDLHHAIIELRPDWASAENDDAETEKSSIISALLISCVTRWELTRPAAAPDRPAMMWRRRLRSCWRSMKSPAIFSMGSTGTSGRRGAELRSCL